MSEHIAALRITAPSLDSFANRHVSIVGKVTQLRGDLATIDADGAVTLATIDADGAVTILMNREVQLTNGNAALFINNVNPDLSIKALSSRDVGTGVDMDLCSQVAQVAQRHKAIFGGADN